MVKVGSLYSLVSLFLILQTDKAISSVFLRDIGVTSRRDTCHQDCIPVTSQGLVYQKFCCEGECWFQRSGMLCWGNQVCDCKNCKCVSPPKPPTPPPDFCPFKGGDPTTNELQPTPPPTPCPGSCYAAGDPYYTSIDGARFNFQGSCRYLLSATVDGEGLPEFAIEVQNQMITRNNEKKAFTKEVIIDLKLYKRVIILKQRGIVQVDGVTVESTDFPKDVNGVNINVLGQVTAVNAIGTPLAFFLQYESRSEDGRHLVFLSYFDDKFRGKLEGICGNWNSVAEDDRIPKGEFAPGADNEVGDSWKTANVCS